MRLQAALPCLVVAFGLAASARADRTQVYSIHDADCADCGRKIKDELKKVPGVKKADFDVQKVELTVRMVESVSDDTVIAAAERAGLKATVGAGAGAYQTQEGYPEGADVQTLSKKGEAVGKLDKLRVKDKYTVFDVYADWCGPCKLVDARLREIMAARKDVAVRKLNVVSFESALAQEMGPDFDSLPYMVVFSPEGKRTDVVGADLARLDRALGAR
jgi:thiol-disulfide isomerase/thioredoxin/copper chaperone CopZ